MARTVSSARSERAHLPLADEIASIGHLRTKSSKRKSRPDEDERDNHVDSQASKKILMISQDLAVEDAAEERAKAVAAAPNPAFDFRPGIEVDDGAGDGRQDYEEEDEWEAEGDVETEV